ncbi:conserved Plasmodium protein, unknown function [Plasmodium berghei]|uniref:Heptatricopeptide repeat-containing protein, putative n=2 Tax=Plasmodium berghei TaxID=5821 RepID=A0A509AKK0_PLABA|nr:heptatricopeptide repeat-containing protein, putative [Plasmodium berghei ANKA]CXI32323.1 conserved Plasmodium protein, unknown function [Plasmodium berghei]SCM21120.1 conserved Plasmodium protein, unknown function [Plasmodium berghei]SCN24474.1 conserved Plasmodium protein, unknown function [Plasmodium berghei]SCO59658.1 conserved Plasmodium protein, unknown function [Plasmodium berghei]SCO60834.1 conserved Plasmodium protein, unknown function [Plasmodium berghei]|eukprot:XP_034421135.1 heptatricopeptide repeat-containing protein, putative [Plasmodium berghei ANKA]
MIRYNSIRLIKLLKRNKNIYLSFFETKRYVSYDTLAGIPWMGHSRITNIFERISNEGPFDKITWERLSERTDKIYNSFNSKEIGRILYSYSKVGYRDIKIIYKFIEKIKYKEIDKTDLLSFAHICQALNNLNYFDKQFFEIALSRILKIKIDNNSFPIIVILNAYAKHCNDQTYRYMCLKLLIYFTQNFGNYKDTCSSQGLVMLLNSLSQIIKPSPDFLKPNDPNLNKIFISNNDKSYLSKQTFHFKRTGKITNIIHDDYISVSNDMNQNLIKLKIDDENYKKSILQNEENNEKSENNTNNHISININIDEKKFMKNEHSNWMNGTEDNPEFYDNANTQNEVDKHYDNIIEKSENKEILKQFFDILLLEISKKIENMNPQSLSLIINSCCRIPFHVSTEFLKIICEQIDKTRNLLTIRHLSLVINGYMKLKIKNIDYISNIFKEIEKKILSCDDQQLCFILSGISKLSNDNFNYCKDNKNLMNKINSKIILSIRKMNISTLCNIMYYYAKLNIYNEDIFNLFQIYLKNLLSNANMHHLSLSAYVFGKYKKKNSLIELVLKKSEEILLKKIESKNKTNSMNIEKYFLIYDMKDALILINSFSELNIKSDILGSYLYDIIHINQKKINLFNENYDHGQNIISNKMHTFKHNIAFLNEHVQDKLLKKNIYLSPKTIALYADWICSPKNND